MCVLLKDTGAASEQCAAEKEADDNELESGLYVGRAWCRFSWCTVRALLMRACEQVGLLCST